MSVDICYADTTQLAKRIASKAVSPVEVISAHLQRIEALNPRIKTTMTFAEGSLARAREAEAALEPMNDMPCRHPPL